VPLASGTNSITITAWDAGGNSASASITVTLGSSPGGGGGTSGGGGHSKRHCLGAITEARDGALSLIVLGVLALAGGLIRRR
jgi:hypothetical protein